MAESELPLNLTVLSLSPCPPFHMSQILHFTNFTCHHFSLKGWEYTASLTFTSPRNNYYCSLPPQQLLPFTLFDFNLATEIMKFAATNKPLALSAGANMAALAVQSGCRPPLESRSRHRVYVSASSLDLGQGLPPRLNNRFNNR